ncbi:MAG: tRNA (guanosine(37)-N1)-methyltransferase TrmD [Verrucomicrobiae bacterium]|nr:tRNA (guanosine(37)-N1)-methyltransferase TrmD [Verrucomicrobiae bacterium]
MRIEVLTLFPGILQGPLQESILKRAQEKNRVQIGVRNIRDWTHDKHNTADDKPYGGGPGMVMKPGPVFEAVDEICGPKRQGWRVVLTSPSGRRLDQKLSQELAQEPNVLLICGHYEGIDDRVRQALVTDEISIGDYVLTNGALAALVIIDSVVRLIPGVLGDECSSEDESFSHGLLEYPHYTRPEEYRGMKVPEILLGGNHAEIEKWRRAQSLEKTRRQRPDLLEGQA